MKAIDKITQEYIKQFYEDKETIDRYLSSLDALFTYHSTSIEGNTLTLAETIALLDDGLTASGKPLEDHQRTKDHSAAYHSLVQSAIGRNPLTPEVIKGLGAIVNKNTGKIYTTINGVCDNTKGEFRNGKVFVPGAISFPDWQKVPGLITEFCKNYNARLKEVSSPLEVITLAATAHLNFTNIHPFYDGNGRVGRLVMNHAQLYHGFPFIIVTVESRAQYIDALTMANEVGNPKPFVEFIIDAHIKRLSEELSAQKKINRFKGFIM